jgi:O-antigen/teichoic acid export membrane protein
MFLRWSKIALTLTIMATLFLTILGPRFIGWWIDPSFEGPSGAVLQILMLSSVAFLPIRGVAQPILVGIGKPEIPAYGFIATGFLNLGLSLALAQPFGIVGVAIGTAVPNVLFAVMVAVVTCRELEIGLWRYVGYVVPRAVAGAVPVLALLLWFRLGLDVSGLVGLAIAGIAAVGLSGLIWIAFVYHRDPLVNLTPHLNRIRVWSRA